MKYIGTTGKIYGKLLLFIQKSFHRHLVVLKHIPTWHKAHFAKTQELDRPSQGHALASQRRFHTWMWQACTISIHHPRKVKINQVAEESEQGNCLPTQMHRIRAPKSLSEASACWSHSCRGGVPGSGLQDHQWPGLWFMTAYIQLELPSIPEIWDNYGVSGHEPLYPSHVLARWSTLPNPGTRAAPCYLISAAIKAP